MIGRDFILAGKAEFTAKSVATGKHFTFRVKRLNRDGRGPIYFVSEVTGDKSGYIGVLDDSTGEVRLTKGSTRWINGRKVSLADVDPVVKAARWVMAQVWHQTVDPAVLELRHCGRCGRCARKLTHPDSLRSGIGPECQGRIGTESTKARSLAGA